MPGFKKKDKANMLPDERDETTDYSESQTIEWIHAFLDEIYRVDDFFSTTQKNLIDQFIMLQDKFRIKTDAYEIGSTKTGKSKKSDKSKGGKATDEQFSLPKDSNASLVGSRDSRNDYMSPRVNNRRGQDGPGNLIDQGGMSRPSLHGKLIGGSG